jgi:hypothetical protein
MSLRLLLTTAARRVLVLPLAPAAKAAAGRVGAHMATLRLGRAVCSEAGPGGADNILVAGTD